MKDILAGLQILIKYDPNGYMSAGHHTIYSGPKDCIVVSEADKAELEKLGWFLDPDGRCWAHFVN